MGKLYFEKLKNIVVVTLRTCDFHALFLTNRYKIVTWQA